MDAISQFLGIDGLKTYRTGMITRLVLFLLCIGVLYNSNCTAISALSLNDFLFLVLIFYTYHYYDKILSQ